MKIFYVFKGSVYKDSAPVNRILGLSKGLLNLNCDISIHNILPVSKAKDLQFPVPVVNYSHLSKFYIWNKLLIMNNLFRISKRIVAEKPSHIIQYGDNLFLSVFLHVIKIRHPFIHILEQNEFPYKVLNNGFWYRIFGQRYLRFSYRWFDRLFVISQTLSDYFLKYVSSKCKVSIIPMTVDPDRFTDIEEVELPFEKNIIYCGSLSQKKDGIENLIIAMQQITSSFPNTGLVILGSGRSDEEHKIKNLVKEQKLQYSVHFCGNVKKDKVPAYLNRASALVLPRPTSQQATGGFPTKLGEYLLSGKPVVSTSVGEIPLYLKDGENAYLIAPDSVRSISDAIEKILLNPEKAAQIGHRGKLTGELYFNANKQAELMLSILKTDNL